MVVDEILDEPVSPSPLYFVKLPKSKSKIIKNNNYSIYCAKYPHYKGLFRKDVNETKKFGRFFCDKVADRMNNFGFFTSDERPKYGISYGITEKEYDYILKQIEANEDHHLVVIFAYPEREALETQTYFENMLRKKYIKHQLNKNEEAFFPVL